MNENLKEVRICLGRFMPFHLGHLKMATYKDLKGPDKDQQDKLREQPNLEDISKQKTIILAVSTPDDKVDTRHPFNDDLMKKEFDIIKKNYKDDIEDVLYVKSADICAWGALLKEAGYKASVWLTGSDEFSFYKGMAIKVPEYEEKNLKNCAGAYTPSFYVEEIERTENKDFVSSISGTKVRQSLLNGDKELFSKMMPKGMEQYFDEFKEKVENAPEPKKKESKSDKKLNKVKEGMRSLRTYILESKQNENQKELNNAIDIIKTCLDKKGYKEDEFKITKVFGNEIRVYFIKGSNTHHEAVSKIGKYIDNELYKAHSKVSHKTMGKGKEGEYYQAFTIKIF